MYRRVQERKAKSDMGEEQFPQLVSVARIVKLPIVEKGWHLANGIYTRIKVKFIFANIRSISV
jgi:hypothetical protein